MCALPLQNFPEIFKLLFVYILFNILHSLHMFRYLIFHRKHLYFSVARTPPPEPEPFQIPERDFTSGNVDNITYLFDADTSIL